MSKYSFAVVDELVRERNVEGEIGVWLRVTDTIFFHVLCQSDANPRYRELGPKRFRELRRQANAKATPEQITERWAELFTDCLILGWEGVVDTDNRPIPYSREACVAFIVAHPRLIKVIDKYTEDETNFRSERKDDAIEEGKNF